MMPRLFQSTHSVGSGTLTRHLITALFISFQSTHSVGSGTCRYYVLFYTCVFQSTHSVGSGTNAYLKSKGFTRISIHPLRGEWDSKTAQKNMQFLYKANNVTDSVCVLCAYDHKTSKNFVHLFTLFCANLPGILCSLMVRIRQPKSLPLHTTFSLRNAQPLFDSDSRDNKIAGYLCLYS